MSALIGTKNTFVAGDASLANRTIVAAGESALILGVYIGSDSGTDAVTATDADGNTILRLAVAENATEDFTAPLIISNGFIVTSTNSSADTAITVVWRPGA